MGGCYFSETLSISQAHVLEKERRWARHGWHGDWLVATNGVGCLRVVGRGDPGGDRTCERTKVQNSSVAAPSPTRSRLSMAVESVEFHPHKEVRLQGGTTWPARKGLKRSTKGTELREVNADFFSVSSRLFLLSCVAMTVGANPGGHRRVSRCFIEGQYSAHTCLRGWCVAGFVKRKNVVLSKLETRAETAAQARSRAKPTLSSCGHCAH